jgi:prepilin-type N-terminal cleavage/methylation domain-containing protein
VRYMSRQVAWNDERGFTLIEVLTTIIIMGIVFAIASSTWSAVVEGRRVDTATNQLAADMRLAHTTAANRLVPQVVNLSDGSSAYSMTGFPSRDLDDDPLSDKVTVDTTVIIAFCPDGSVEIPPSVPVCSVGAVGGPTTITVGLSTDPTQEPNHTIEVNAVTSRIQVAP